MNISTKITINGHSYHNTDEMPSEVRAQYERSMAMFRGGDVAGIANKESTSVVSESIVCNGRTYKNRDELPLHIQALIDKTAAANPQKSTTFHIKRTGTFGPQVAFDRQGPAEDERAAADPVLAWTLVKILSGVIVILLFLLGAKHYGWW